MGLSIAHLPTKNNSRFMSLDLLDFGRPHFVVKNGEQDFTTMPRFCPIHSNGKTIYITAAVGRFYDGSAPASRLFQRAEWSVTQ